jgi:hypothetical protein
MSCSKKSYTTQAEAQAALARCIASAKETGRGGKSWRRLNAYQCRTCRLWHLGRADTGAFPKKIVQPPKQSPGKLRRQAAKEADHAQRQAFYADYHHTLSFCKMLVDREIARMEALGVPKRNAGR